MLKEMLVQYHARFRQLSAQGDGLEIVRVSDELCDEIKKLNLSVTALLAELQSLLDERCWEFGEDIVFAAQSNPSNEYVPLLCAILDLAHPRGPNENIIELLTDLEDPRSVPSLVRALDYRHETDAGIQVPIRALNALAKIGTDEAIAAIDAARNSDEELIRDEAELLLEDL
jgi:hypothetical protein